MSANSEPSSVDKMVAGTSPNDRKEILGELIDSGLGVEPDDLMLQIPGLANHFRAIAQALERTTKSVPTLVDRQVGEQLDRYEAKLAATLDRVEAVKIPSRSRSSFYGLCPMSALLGALTSMLLTLALAWYLLVPREVAKQRGSDWAIATYLNSPKGKAVRKYFEKCRSGNQNCRL
jgi:hypothetical protein